MSAGNPDHLIDRHEAFLECRAADRPLVGCWVGGYFPAEQFPRRVSSWVASASLQPEEVSFGPFAEDYEELYRSHRACDDDFFYVGSAYWGIPWLEAILGCPVFVADAGCRTEPAVQPAAQPKREPIAPQPPPPLQVGLVTGESFVGPSANAWRGGPGVPVATAPRAELDDAEALETNPWLNALVQFTRDLVEFSNGRFPVCAPLLRGPGDAACALLGGEAFVTGLLDEPKEMIELLARCAAVRLAVLRRLSEIIPAWHGTHVAGGYPSKVWCRRTVAYYQEDCAALLSPGLFREFILPPAREACRATDVNFIHLHSGCLYPVDILLEDDSFDALEINIDHRGAGPPVPELIETFQRIQRAGRPLLLWGECSPDDWDLICRRLSPIGFSLQPMIRTPQTKWRNS